MKKLKSKTAAVLVGKRTDESTTDNPQSSPMVAAPLAPDWVIEQIYEAEGAFNRSSSTGETLHFIDKTAALSSTVHDYSSRPGMTAVVTLYHLRLFALQVSVWHEWIPSSANIADIPSRTLDAVDDPVLKHLNAVEVPFVFPPESHWNNPENILEGR